MRKILIIGAGQSGLQLGLSLLAEGYDVTIMSARTPAEIRGGWPTSTQVMFEPALRAERQYGLDTFEQQTPPIHGLRVTAGAPGGAPAVDFTGDLVYPGRSTDQRLKMARWLEMAEERGGEVIYGNVTTQDLNDLTAHGLYDLPIVAAGRGDLSAAFDRDPRRSPYTTPQRALAASYVHGLQLETSRVQLHVVEGLGELFVIPSLSVAGPCHILFWEAVPGSPLDLWPSGPRLDPAEHLSRTLGAIKTYLPSLYEQCRRAELADSKATLHGRYTPTVRHPVAILPSEVAALGVADVVISNDPLTGQGANTAAKCAEHYLAAILAHGDRAFDQSWMRHTFEGFWQAHGQAVTQWTNMMLQPPAAHVLQLFGAATLNRAVANRFANGFTDPNDFGEWFITPGKAAAYLAETVGVAD